MFLLIFFHAALLNAQSLIIDHHDVALFDSIPEEYRQAASDLKMVFMDRSVGFNISSYLDCLSNPWSSAPSFCKRYHHQDSLYDVDPSEVYWDGTWDRSNWYYRAWPEGCSEDVNCFIGYVQSRMDSFDVMGCQFSYLAVATGSQLADPLTGFFGSQGNDNKASTLQGFSDANPDKKIIWWTTSLARGIGTPESESFNDRMREYAEQHEIILFDVADILSHDPAGQPCYDNRDGIAYKDENHPDDGQQIPAICPQYTTETEGGHLGAISAGGVRVAKAFWVLMANVAGWGSNTTSVYTQHDAPAVLIYPNPTTDHFFFRINQNPESLQVYLTVLSGKVIPMQTYPTGPDEIRLSIDPSIPGMFIVHWKTAHHSGTEKISVL